MAENKRFKPPRKRTWYLLGSAKQRVNVTLLAAEEVRHPWGAPSDDIQAFGQSCRPHRMLLVFQFAQGSRKRGGYASPLLDRSVLSALAAGLCRPLRIILEIAAGTASTLGSTLALLFVVHGCKAALAILGLVALIGLLVGHDFLLWLHSRFVRGYLLNPGTCKTVPEIFEMAMAIGTERWVQTTM